MASKKLSLWVFPLFLLTLLSCTKDNSKKKETIDSAATGKAQGLSLEEVRAIAKEAYIYGFPIVDNSRVQYAFFVNKLDSDYKAPWNTICNIPRVFTPKDKTIQTPNSDTPYSWIGLDLRAEPIVFTIPVIEKNRYWSLQLIDLYTHNFDYLGSRTTGNGGGNFMIAGPRWKGKTPKNITKVIYCETEIASAQFRTQLYNVADLKNVIKIQNQYIAKPLSAFLGKPEHSKIKDITYIKPLTRDQENKSLQVFNNLNFALQFCPTHPSEINLMKRFAKIGVAAGNTIDTLSLSPEIKKAMHDGIRDAWADFKQLQIKLEKGEVSPSDGYGTRAFLKNNYLFRMMAAALGIYGNTKEEAMYPAYYIDSKGDKLDGKYRYTIRFSPHELPPVNSFWSLTMYEQPSSLLVENSLNRYLLNSTMMSQFKKDPDGGLTLIIQNQSPGKEKESNWLPAPKGPFSMIMRLYWPKEKALNGSWKQPPLVKKD
ncbi:DUF1254 domain-containing protein [Flavobacterium beibuense]|uniref:Cell envelope protein n=1 Tax=Flavobacterium beibuense TaxID=657326 RepID=A0A444WAA9_9FLAO|nr:DUF1254 domain-containing protein [Flavobacterium beibuense]RYJ42784.1 cell envelope protein [Flavobacterium beibuense]